MQSTRDKTVSKTLIHQYASRKGSLEVLTVFAILLFDFVLPEVIAFASVMQTA